MEIVTSCCFGYPFNALDCLNFNHPALIALLSATRVYFFLQHFPFIIPLAFHLPNWLKGTELLAVENVFKGIEKRIDELLTDPSSFNQLENKTIFYHLLHPNLSHKQPSRRSILDEVSALIVIGSDPVANACSVGIFQVLSNPKVRSRLVEELVQAWPDKNMSVGVEALEKLPYLVRLIFRSGSLVYVDCSS
jgi:cytochrome P450